MEYDIKIFHGKYTDNLFMKRLSKVAEKQKSNYINIFPWRNNMTKNMLMIVALNNYKKLRSKTPNPIICPTNNTNILGWLTAFVYDDHVYLSEISTSRCVKGVGFEIFKVLLKYCEDNCKKFIYLFPLNDIVKNIYEKWGLQKEEKYMYYVFDVDNTNVLQKIKTIQNNAKQKCDDDLDIISEELSKSQIDFLKTLQEQDKNLYDNLIIEIQNIIMKCSNDANELIENCFKQCKKRKLLGF